MNQDTHQSTVEIVTSYSREEKRRWRRGVLALIFLGALISILVHYNIWFVLEMLVRGGPNSNLASEGLEIQFAVMESEHFSDLPLESVNVEHAAAPTEAQEITTNVTQATLEPVSAVTMLEATRDSMPSSLAGSNSSGMGVTSGGSGGGASFFGISSKGSSFCYIVDVSGSMKSNNRLNYAMAELSNSIKQLPDFAKFYVLFYSSGVKEPSIQRGWNSARRRVVNKMIEEFGQIRATGGTEPEEAFAKAFALKPLPEVIFFLTDGEISGFTTEDLKGLMPARNKVVINTIAFGTKPSPRTTQLLNDFCKMTGGKYRFVSTAGGSP